MHLDRKPDFDAAAARIEAWWRRILLDRPPVTIQVDAETFLAETFPLVEPNPSPELAAAVFGAPLQESGGGLRARPLSATSRDIARLAPNLGAPAWRQVLAAIDDSLARGGGRWITCMPNLYTGPDLLAALRGPEDLCADLADDPESVLAAADRCQAAFEAMFDEAWGRIRDARQPCCTAWTPLLHAGPAYPLGCDFMNLVSPAMFRQSLLPSIERAVARLGRSLFHFDGPRSLFHLDTILALPRLDAVHWLHGPGEGPAARWGDVYRKIQAAGKALQLITDNLADARAVAAHLRPEGVWFCPAGTYARAEAEDFIAWTVRWACPSGRRAAGKV